MLPFGDIMLPIIGLVAMGLLLVGVKMFFLSGTPTPPSVPSPELQQVVRTDGRGEHQTPLTIGREASQEPLNGAGKGTPSVIAVPVGSSEKAPAPAQPEAQKKTEPVRATTVTPKAQPKAVPAVEPKKPSPAPAAKPTTTTTAAKTSPTAKAPSASTSTWGVQIGSFTSRNGAEAVSAQAKKAGYSAVITSAQVNGRSFYRVTVPAGMSQSDADALSKKLSGAGFPVVTVRMR